MDWIGTTIDHFGGPMPPFDENDLPNHNQFAFLVCFCLQLDLQRRLDFNFTVVALMH